MKPIEKVLIVGAGAIGTAIGSIIEKNKPGSVAVLADGERYDRYNREGFVVNGEKIRFPVVAPVQHALRDGVPGEESRSSPFFDLVIVAVKYHHLQEAIQQMAGHVGPETTILSLLNGISSEEILGQTFGAGPGAPEGVHIPPYAMILGIDAVRLGNETRFASTGKIYFGETLNKEGSYSPRVARLKAFFDAAGVPYVIPENMLRSLWFKFMINVGINQASAILRASYRVFQQVPEAKAVMEALQREVIAISQVLNINLGEEDLAAWEKTLAGLHPDNYTSMCQDVLASRKTEVEMFAGTVIALGRQYHIPTPANEMAYNLIKAMESLYLH
ncbi:MAG: ketopantoate reductase family protein [Treponemataceae bacterium]|nr:ketopantoate reductase family protein [Treponemataceae bacterium]